MSEDNAREREAAEWVACQIGGEPFDHDGFAAWLARDERHQLLFETMWQRIMGPKMDEALGAYAGRRRAKQSLLVASVAAFLTLLGGYRAWPSVELFLTRPRDYVAQDGTIREVTLADGTRLTLAGGSDIRVRYTAHDRVADLVRGTIFADVAHDEKRPFRIEIDRARITDIGTRFEVEKKPSDLRVAVEAGAVRFGAGGWLGAHLDLGARQAAILSDAGLHRTDDVPANDIARWRTGWVEYRDTPMSEVIGDLESVSPMPIRLADQSLGDLRVSGRIRLADPLGQLNNLAVIHNFSVGRANGAILLSKKSAGS